MLSLPHTFPQAVACIHVVAHTHRPRRYDAQRVIAYALRGGTVLSSVETTQWDAVILRRKHGQSSTERHHVGTRSASEHYDRSVVRTRPDTRVTHDLDGHTRPRALRSRR